jgi:hypothetical protein
VPERTIEEQLRPGELRCRVERDLTIADIGNGSDGQLIPRSFDVPSEPVVELSEGAEAGPAYAGVFDVGTEFPIGVGA